MFIVRGEKIDQGARDFNVTLLSASKTGRRRIRHFFTSRSGYLSERKRITVDLECIRGTGQ
jgi:hypothetical protein